MNQFNTALNNKIQESVYNNYGIDNYDILRFGNIHLNNNSLEKTLKDSIKKILGYRKAEIADAYIKKLEYSNELNLFWNILDKEGKKLLVELIAYRLLGYKKVKLSINNAKYHNAIETAYTLSDKNDIINPGFLDFKLQKINLNPIGKNIQLYFSPLWVANDFILEQYTYKQHNKPLIEAHLGDTVFDIGGCWGDTALYFADKVGSDGKVYSFEFIPGNIELHNKNTLLNPHLKNRIELISNPVSDKTGEIIYFKDHGPCSQIKMEPFADQTGSTTTLSIDDFVDQNAIKKVDFIKMDIEGAEPLALMGAINTIKKYRPKLAIAIYHSMSDFVRIPLWIHDLNLNYELYLGHYTIHAEETIIFAKSRK